MQLNVTITHRLFAGDIEAVDKICKLYKVESTENTNDIQSEIKQKNMLEKLRFSKTLGSASDYGSKPEVLLRLAQATAALTKLKPIRRDIEIKAGFSDHNETDVLPYHIHFWSFITA